MPRYIEVVGDYDDEVEGADVMGYAGPMGNFQGGASVVGYNAQGYPMVVGATPAQRRQVQVPHGSSLVQVRQPGWRRSQLAPGVIAPDEGLLTLPMGNFTFSVANGQTNTFQGQVQKPFRGERFLIRVVRTGTSATGTIQALIFVGTDLMQLSTDLVDIESLATPQAFGARMSMKPCQPGVFVKVVSSLSTALTSTDTISVSLQLLGRNVH